MSLQLAAQHLSSQGRGNDSMLVHMSPREVKSLNDLAMAHGGQLSINPDTGLPEAGFLSSILPMVAGAALASTGVGAPMAALMVGGGMTLATGSLSKGLMAGLGAYGGAGLGESLAASGMQAEAAAAEAAKTGPFAANAASAVPPPPPPINYANLGIPDSASSVMAKPGNISDVFTKASSAPLGAPMTASGVPVANLSASQNLNYMGQGLKTLGTGSGFDSLASNAGGGMSLAKYGLAAAAPTISDMMSKKEEQKTTGDKDMGQRYVYSPNKVEGPYTADPQGREQRYFNPAYTAIDADKAKGIYGFAAGGVPTATPQPGEKPSYEYDPMKQLFAKIESMPSDDQSRQAAEAQMQEQRGGINQGPMSEGQQLAGQQNLARLGDLGTSLAEGAAKFKQALINGDVGIIGPIAKAIYGQMPASSGGVGKVSGSPMRGIASSGTNAQVAAAVNAANAAAAGGGGGGKGNVGIGSGATTSGVGTGIGASVGNSGGGLRAGGLSHLGDYSDGGRLLRGPGDGVSDSIPAVIGKKQPARLADGEFVVPARIVSELGNGSTEAGARKLYAMMDRIQSARGKTVGKGKVAKNSRSEKYLPA